MDIPQQKTLPRDVFLYLLVIVVLTMSSISLWSLLVNFVNVYLPDSAQPVCWYDSCAGSIRSALSFLMVAFPVLVWAWRFIRRDVQAHPEKADLRVRRWLLYLTLFVAGIVVIGDLIALINSWLQGELTLQFALKVLAVLLISGSIFSYFLRELHPEKSSRQRVIAGGAIVAVTLAIIAGFLTAGSPGSARDKKLDQQRVNDLSVIQGQIVSVFWTAKGRLPQVLGELEDSVSGFQVPNDPVTKESYEYVPTGSRTFRLCATFVFPSTSTQPVPAYYPLERGSTWDHGVGKQCFDRTIDPQLYPPKS